MGRAPKENFIFQPSIFWDMLVLGWGGNDGSVTKCCVTLCQIRKKSETDEVVLSALSLEKAVVPPVYANAKKMQKVDSS